MPIPQGPQASAVGQQTGAVQAPAVVQGPPANTRVPAAGQTLPGMAHKKKSTTKSTTAETEVAPAPVVPPTLEQMPPTAPRVSYLNGQLSINAHNSTLSQVLRSVQQQTGATIDVPGGASGERVVANLGPGRPRDVLASLLNGSHFNYVILGTPGDSGGVQKVILTNRQSAAVATAQATPAPQQQALPSPDDENPPEDDQAATYPDSDVPQGTPLVPGQGQRPGVEQGPNEQGQSPDAQNPSQPQNQVKTPEQLLQELQRMQQQQQQYQQQLNPANQQPMNPPDQPQQ